MDYSLEALQKLYGRDSDAVSRNARPLNIKRLKAPWGEIMEEAIAFIHLEYNKDSVPLSIRQIHYYLVSSPKTIAIYKNDAGFARKLTTNMLKARIGGQVPWHMISEEESTVSHTEPVGMDPEEAIREAIEAAKYATGKNPWDIMKKYVVIFSEKRELGPQLKVITDNYYVRLVCTRGYGMWSRFYYETQRIKKAVEEGKQAYALFVTDHDPSGIDINRFGASIIRNFWAQDALDMRVMLTIDQIEEGKLPPNPTKIKDPRSTPYIGRFGRDSWEVDALGKARMQEVLKDAIMSLIDAKVWNDVMEENRENFDRTEELAKEHLDKL